MTHRVRSTLIAAAALLLSPLAGAGVIGTAGDVSLIPAPAAATKNSDISMASGDSSSFVWFESAGVLGADLTIDFDTPGTRTGNPNNIVLGAGTYVESYMIFFDVQGSATGSSSGSVTFDADVIGVIGQEGLLRQSHDLLGAVGTEYITGSNSFQGIWDSRGDSVTLGNDLRTIDFNFTVGTAIDSIRILTQASPVPSPAPLVLLLVGALALLRRR